MSLYKLLCAYSLLLCLNFRTYIDWIHYTLYIYFGSTYRAWEIIFNKFKNQPLFVQSPKISFYNMNGRHDVHVENWSDVLSRLFKYWKEGLKILGLSFKEKTEENVFCPTVMRPTIIRKYPTAIILLLF